MIEIKELTKHYLLGGQEVRALDGIDMTIPNGEFLRIVGSSGSGKSTLLNLIAGLDTPTSGSISTPFGELATMTDKQRSRWRSEYIGMVFQSFNLINHHNALYNVGLGLLFKDAPSDERQKAAIAMLTRLGMAERLHHKPADLSGGEQQRVALARALVKKPTLLLADEPTGNLDRENALQIESLLADLNREGLTVVVVTHDPEFALSHAHRTLHLSFGKQSSEETHRSLDTQETSYDPA